MIPLIEIKEKAVAEGVPETTVIKDYALSWMLKALNDVSDAFALKGGTGIRKAYIEGYRFSVDLDFTLTESVDVREVLLEAVRLARRESGIEFGKALGLKSVRTGYEARVMFRLYYHFPMKIKIDVTTPEREDSLYTRTLISVTHCCSSTRFRRYSPRRFVPSSRGLGRETSTTYGISPR